jgi:formylglycine-generating enzyme required for sulfatase activity
MPSTIITTDVLSRGGGWLFNTLDVRASSRGRDVPAIRFAFLGFQCA